MSAVLADQPPKNVILFSGHMIDAPDRRTPRFPADKEPIAASAIAATLSEIGAVAGDLAICGGACGGDLLFAEACLARDMRLEIYIPLDEADVPCQLGGFRRRQLARPLSRGQSRRRRCTSRPMSWARWPEGENAYERNNQWMLNSAARFGGDRMAFISLWNGQGGDGPGGAQHLMEEARRKTSRIYWLDTRKLWD